MALPEILAGPILRRTDTNAVLIWIATRDEKSIEGFIYEADSLEVKGHGMGETIRFGNRFFITLVTIVPVATDEGKSKAQPFQRDKLLCYDLKLTPLDKKTGSPIPVHKNAVRLSDMEEIKNGIGIAYPPYKLPTFFIPAKGNFNIMHGSCRKLHGTGDDALAAVDRIIKKNLRDLSDRPCALMLTGDQIYADDVDDGLISAIAQLGFELLGVREYVPGNSVRYNISGIYGRSSGFLRGRIIKDIFSPDNAEKDPANSTARNHLLGFGDFAAMYLLSWNPKMWDPQTSLSSDVQKLVTVLPYVRRALANIAVYMVMDDHEITDDWNITQEWESRVKSNVTGRRVVANGLAAYWAFQAWGNDPDENKFSKHFKNILARYFGDFINGEEFENALLFPDSSVMWAFVTATDPPIFFLDSRTHRKENELGKQSGKPSNYPSGLLNDDALKEFEVDLSLKNITGNLLLIVAQTPVFGSPDTEAYLEKDGLKNPPKSVYEDDLEFWHANRAGFYTFLEKICKAAPSACLILSGDVHYGFVSRASVTLNQVTVPITQFTSSSLKNMPTGKSRYALSTQTKGARPDKNYGWIKSPTSKATRVDKFIKQILSVSPVVLTNHEVLQAIPAEQPDMQIVNRPIFPTSPDLETFFHQQTNIGQVVFNSNGSAALRFYDTKKEDPFAEYIVQLTAHVGSTQKSDSGSKPPLKFFYHGTSLEQGKKFLRDDVGVFDYTQNAPLDYAEYTDFGKGFYTFPEESKTLAFLRAKEKNKEWAVIRLAFLKEEIDAITSMLLYEDKASRPRNSPILPTTGDIPATWLQFVEYNRHMGPTIARPGDNDWTQYFGWMKGPLWVPKDSRINKGRKKFPDDIHQINWGIQGLEILNNGDAKKRRCLFTKENEKEAKLPSSP
jgi:hypothetical protein